MSITPVVPAITFVAVLAQTLLAQSLQIVSLTHHTGEVRRGVVRMRPDGVSGDNVTLKQLIRYAYDLQDVQILGPAWIATEAYSIEAKAASRLTSEQGRSALQGLLVDQFRLNSHREKKDLRGYRLVV